MAGCFAFWAHEYLMDVLREHRDTERRRCSKRLLRRFTAVRLGQVVGISIWNYFWLLGLFFWVKRTNSLQSKDMPQPTCELWQLTVVEVLTAHKRDLVRGAKVVGTWISISVTIMVEVRGQDAVLARAGQTTTETTVVEDLVKDGMIKEATVTGATTIRTRSVAPGHQIHVMTGAHLSGPTPKMEIRLMIKGVTVRKKSAVTVRTVSGAGTEFRLPEKVSVTGAEAEGATMTTIATGARKLSRGGGVVAVQIVRGGPAAVTGASPPAQVTKHLIHALFVVVPTTICLNVGLSILRKPLKTGTLPGEMRTRGRKAKIILLLRGGAVRYQGQVLCILPERSRQLPGVCSMLQMLTHHPLIPRRQPPSSLE